MFILFFCCKSTKKKSFDKMDTKNIITIYHVIYIFCIFELHLVAKQ